jgi:hypothetical protein
MRRDVPQLVFFLPDLMRALGIGKYRCRTLRRAGLIPAPDVSIGQRKGWSRRFIEEWLAAGGSRSHGAGVAAGAAGALLRGPGSHEVGRGEPSSATS